MRILPEPLRASRIVPLWMLLAVLVVTVWTSRLAAQAVGVVAADRTNLRESPAIDAAIVGTLSRGTSVTVVERRETWARVTNGSLTGWIRTSALGAASSPAQSPASSSASQSPSPSPRSSAPSQTGSPAKQPTREATPSSNPSSSGGLPAGAFEIGDNMFGAVIGFGGLGEASSSFGGRFERAVKALPDLANGTLSFGLDADYYRYVYNGQPYSASEAHIPLAAHVSYHFRLDDRRWDPFVGLGLGYTIVSYSESYSGRSGTYSNSFTERSSTYLLSRIGARYFLTSSLAAHADTGVGGAVLNIGAVWKM